MREALLLAVALLAFLGAAFVPGGAIDSVGQGAQDAAAAAATATAASPPETRRTARAETQSYAAWAAGSTELPRAADGHFYAEASVDGIPLHFLVDTGATLIALTGEDAQALGLSWSDADVGLVAQGASGPVFGLHTRLESVRLGGHEAREVEAMIIPEGLGISLLGQSFLGTVQPVRIESDRMVLGE